MAGMIFDEKKKIVKGNIFCFLKIEAFDRINRIFSLWFLCLCGFLFINNANLFAQQTYNLEVIWVKTSPESVFFFGRCIGSGDVNGDGYSDIMIVGDSVIDLANPDSAYQGKCWIYFGSIELDTVPDVCLLNSRKRIFSSVHSSDINGDSYSDIILGASYNPNGEVLIFLGSNPMNTIYDYRIIGPHGGSQYGLAISSGDVNGDSYNDLIVGAYGAAPMPGGADMGQVFIYFGGPNFDTIPDVILNGGHHNDREGFGSDIGQCADVNNDGYEDLIIGACNFGMCHGRLYIYFGGNPMNTVEEVTMMGERPNHHLGWGAISSLRNISNFDYAMIGTSLWPDGFFGNINKGKIYVLYGGAQMDSIPDICITGRTQTSRLSQSLSRAGHIMGNFIDDIIAGAPIEYDNKGTAYLWLGGTLLDTTPDAWLRGVQYDDGIGWKVASAGDVDGDGRDEIMVSNYASNYSPKRVWVCKYTGVGIEEEHQPLTAVSLPLEVYPNPASSVLRVRCPLSVKDVKIYDVSGKVVREIASPSARNDNQTEMKISLKGISAGIYFIELVAEQGNERIREIRKIVITK